MKGDALHLWLRSKTMLEVLYSKKLNNDGLGRTVIVSSEYAYCPSCHKSTKLDDMTKEYECEDFNVAELRCKHCGEVHYVKLNRWHSCTKPTIIQRRNTKKYGNKALEYTRVSNPLAKLTNEMICVDRDSGKIVVFMRYMNIITTKSHLVFEPYFDKYIFNYKKHTAYMVKHKTYSGKKAFGYQGAPLINITNARYGLWDSYVQLWSMSVELLETLMKVYFEIANLPLCDELRLVAQSAQTCDDPSKRDYKAAMFEIINTMNRCPNLLIDHDAYVDSYKFSSSTRFPFFSKSFARDFPKTIVDKQEMIRNMTAKYNVPNSKSFWKLYLDDITNLDKAIYFKQCGFGNPDVIRSLIIGNTFLSRIESDFKMNCFDICAMTKSCEQFRQIVKKMNEVSQEHVVANRLLDNWHIGYMQDMISMYHKIKQYDVKLLEAIDWAQSIKEIHDDLSLINNKIRYANTPIRYGTRERLLETRINDFEFKLPVDTNELVAIGQEMKICVGSYRDQVLAKNSIIVSIQRDEKYVGCIELDSAFNLRQIKGKRNSYLIGNVGDAAIKWVKSCGIKNYNCMHDFTNIGKESKCSYDYHNLELDANGNVTTRRRENFDFDEDLPF